MRCSAWRGAAGLPLRWCRRRGTRRCRGGGPGGCGGRAAETPGGGTAALGGRGREFGAPGGGGGAAAGALSKRCPGPWLRLPAGLALRVSTSGGAQEHR